MAVYTPDGVQAEGNVAVWFVSTLSDIEAPTDDEIDAGVQLAGYIKGGMFQPTGDQATGDDRRLASRESFQVLGRITRGFDDIEYVYNPQTIGDNDEDNAAYEALSEGSTGWIVTRWGADADTDIAAGDIVDVTPVECGAQRKVGPAENDEFARLVVRQKLGVTGPSAVDVAVQAAGL